MTGKQIVALILPGKCIHHGHNEVIEMVLQCPSRWISAQHIFQHVGHAILIMSIKQGLCEITYRALKN